VDVVADGGVSFGGFSPNVAEATVKPTAEVLTYSVQIMTKLALSDTEVALASPQE
jgi:hypothetical protein